jgi:2-polyprenyl-6-methoxyphenol hydroxylase-like FAD-dependent oxidoreductase
MYDVIIIGARVAGASTALLLARKGLRVLCVDRATFPSDALSSHQVQLPGVASLMRWGLLEQVIAAGTPPTRQVRFDSGGVVLSGRFPAYEGVDALYSPRRVILDKLIVDAARRSGAEVREGFLVDEMTFADGEVTGIRGRERHGRPVTETAPLVIGADGKHSFLATAVAAPWYRKRPILSVGYYSYWEALATQGGEMYARDRRAIGVWPTNDGLVVTFLSAPLAEFGAFRSNVESACLDTLDRVGELGARMRAAKQVGPFRGTADLPNGFRKPYGSHWALVGDAGFVMDPITGQGISQALRDAELLSDEVSAAFEGKRTFDAALSEYERQRNLRAFPIYEFTTEMASFHRREAEETVLLETLAGNQDEIDRFFGLITGAVRYDEYRSMRHMLKLLGVRGVARATVGRIARLVGLSRESPPGTNASRHVL